MHLTLTDMTMDKDGTATTDLIADHIPAQDGFVGYIIGLNIADPTVAEVTGIAYNSELKGLTSTTAVPFTNGTVGWADTDHILEPGNSRTGIRLATITIQGKKAGSTVLETGFSNLDGDNPNWADLIPGSTITSPRITVTDSAAAVPTTSAFSPIIIPDAGGKPADLDNDGLCEDINGDGVLNYSDTSFFFYHWHWIESNEPVALFDFDKNGNIDFGDIIVMNEKRG
jgi:PKD repeat protein